MSRAQRLVVVLALNLALVAALVIAGIGLLPCGGPGAPADQAASVLAIQDVLSLRPSSWPPFWLLSWPWRYLCHRGLVLASALPQG
ncbi:MAG: hypothetical protein ACXV5Q_17060, partial [Frankiaceae bacterium]